MAQVYSNASLVIGTKTLLEAGHMTTCETNFSTGVESTKDFCHSQLTIIIKPHTAKCNFEILQPYSKLQKGKTKYICNTLISISASQITRK